MVENMEKSLSRVCYTNKNSINETFRSDVAFFRQQDLLVPLKNSKKTKLTYATTLDMY